MTEGLKDKGGSPNSMMQTGAWRYVGKAGQILAHGTFAVLMVLMALLVVCLVQSRLSGGPPSFWGYQMYIVTGGSMSPAFEAGSLAILRPVDSGEVQVGDIITFQGVSSRTPLTTHRVVGVEESGMDRSFITRGDANEINDPLPVIGERLLGQVVYAIPYAGRLMDFGQTRNGLLSLVIIPGVFIIAFEVRNLLSLSAQLEKEGRQEENPDHRPGQIQ